MTMLDSDAKKLTTYWNYLPKSYWGKNRMSNWILYSPMLSQYAETFHSKKIDFKTFSKIDQNYLKEIGVKSDLHCLFFLGIVDLIKDIPSKRYRIARKNSAPMWTTENVLDWLDSLPFGWQYIKRFEDHKIDGKRLVRLNGKSLEILIGIKKRSLSKRYILAINSLSKSGNWKHLPNLEYDSETGNSGPAFGFFSSSYVVSSNFKGANKKTNFENIDLNEAFFPFNNSQINLAMFTYKDEYTRKKKKNTMDVKDVVLWLIHLDYPKKIVGIFEQNEIDGIILFEINDEYLLDMGIDDEKIRVRILCDINLLKTKMKKMFEITNLINLYQRKYNNVCLEEKSELVLYNENKTNDLIKPNECFLVRLRETLLNPSRIVKKEIQKKELKQKNLNDNKNHEQQLKTKISTWTENDVMSWAQNNETTSLYLECFEGINGINLLEFPNNKSNLIEKFKLNESECSELFKAISQLIDNYGEKQEKIQLSARKARARNDEVFLRMPLQNVLAAENNRNRNESRKRPIYKRPFIVSEKRLQLNNHSNVFKLNRQNIFQNPHKVIPISNTKSPPPPPPNESRPPFDVGEWTSEHVNSYLKNIKSLKPFLDKLKTLNGRTLLDLDQNKFKELKIFNENCIKTLKSVVHTLAFRDLKNVPVESWNPSNVKLWFEIETNFPKYGQIFKQKNVNGKILVQLTHEMLLCDFEIEQYEREKILKNIQKLISRTKPFVEKLNIKKSENKHNSIPISLWTGKEIISWLNSFKFGNLYLENFLRFQVTGKDLMRATNETLREMYQIPISSHRDQLINSLNNYKSSLKDEELTSIYTTDTYPSPFYDYNMPYSIDTNSYSLGSEPKEATVVDSIPKNNDQKNKSCSFCLKRFNSIESLTEHVTGKHMMMGQVRKNKLYNNENNKEDISEKEKEDSLIENLFGNKQSNKDDIVVHKQNDLKSNPED